MVTASKIYTMHTLSKFLFLLKDEKASHALTMEKLLLQEHESKQLRVERHSLKVGLDAANMTLDRMENEAATIKQRLKEQENLDCKDINAINGGNQIVGQVIFNLRKYLRNEISYVV